MIQKERFTRLTSPRGILAGALIGSCLLNGLGGDPGTVPTISDLPGYGVDVNESAVRDLRGATVQVYVRDWDTDWEPACSALAFDQTQLDGAIHHYVITAKHCIQYNDPETPETVDQTINITHEAKHIFGIGPNNNSSYTTSDVGQARGISASLISDVALIEVEDALLDPSIKPIDDLLSHLEEQENPKRGESSTAISQIGTSNEIVEGNGVFLGDLTEDLSLVALYPESPESNACNNGASGSFAVVGNGYMVGPASMTNPTGYDAENEAISPDQLTIRNGLEKTMLLQIPTTDVPVVCYYVRPSASLIQQLISALPE